ncbi:hypothetical protein D3C76_1633210 [compost metagenome]
MHGGSDWVTAICCRFDGSDLLTFGGCDRRDAGTNGLTIKVNSASTTQCCAAAKLGAGHAQRVTQDPKNWGARVYVNRVVTAIDIEGAHSGTALR